MMVVLWDLNRKRLLWVPWLLDLRIGLDLGFCLEPSIRHLLVLVRTVTHHFQLNTTADRCSWRGCTLTRQAYSNGRLLLTKVKLVLTLFVTGQESSVSACPKPFAHLGYFSSNSLLCQYLVRVSKHKRIISDFLNALSRCHLLDYVQSRHFQRATPRPFT